MSEHNEIPHVHTEPDAWHRHSSEEGMPQEEHGSTVNPTALSIVFVAMVFGIVFVLLILTAYFNNYTYTFKARQVEGVPVSRQVYETENEFAQLKLSTYGWIDRNAGSVHVPLDTAYQTVIAQYQEADGR